MSKDYSFDKNVSSKMAQIEKVLIDHNIKLDKNVSSNIYQFEIDQIEKELLNLNIILNMFNSNIENNIKLSFNNDIEFIKNNDNLLNMYERRKQINEKIIFLNTKLARIKQKSDTDEKFKSDTDEKLIKQENINDGNGEGVLSVLFIIFILYIFLITCFSNM